MKSNGLLFSVALLCILVSCSDVRDSYSKMIYQCEIVKYCATFELFPNNSDVRVELDITYLIGNRAKSEGFKYVGNCVVDSLQCIDESGAQIRSSIEHLRENRINWFFTPVKSCSKRILVHFILKDFLRSTQNRYVIDAAWAGVFRIPVAEATYRLIFPIGEQPMNVNVISAVYTTSMLNDRFAINVSQSPLKKKSFYVAYER